MNWRFVLSMGVLAVAMAGCAPKRVTSAGVVSATPRPDPATPVSREAVVTTEPTTTASALPDPEPLSRSGTATAASASRAARPGLTVLGPRAVELAKAQLGKPYQWGAAGPNKFDCSGLVQYVYSNLGVALPRVSRQQASAGVHVDREDLQPGDLVFFTLAGSRIDHVGIYVGHSKFIHAPRRYSPVREDSLHNTWWLRKFKGGRRVG